MAECTVHSRSFILLLHCIIYPRQYTNNSNSQTMYAVTWKQETSHKLLLFTDINLQILLVNISSSNIPLWVLYEESRMLCAHRNDLFLYFLIVQLPTSEYAPYKDFSSPLACTSAHTVSVSIASSLTVRNISSQSFGALL